jgi:hypothetical protein
MHSKLDSDELFNLLSRRYTEFSDYSGFDMNGNPHDAESHNGILATLKDFTESFSKGRLKVIPAPETIRVSSKETVVK